MLRDSVVVRTRPRAIPLAMITIGKILHGFPFLSHDDYGAPLGGPLGRRSSAKKILYMGFRATLKFRKNEVALNSMYRIFLNFAKSCVLSCLSNVDNIKKNFTVPFLNYKPLKLQLRVFLASNIVAMVTYCVTKMVTTCSPMVGQFFDTMIVASSDKEW